MSSLLISGAIPGASARPYKNIQERFWAKAPERSPWPDHCWLWMAGSDGDGYGAFAVGTKKRMRAHRVAWFLSGGDIQAGMELDHACRNRMCVRPEHLTLVEKFYNARQGSSEQARRKVRQTHCKRGHEYKDGSFFLTPEGWRSCRVCVNENARRHYRKNRVVILEKAHTYYLKNGESIRARERERRQNRDE